MSNDPVKQPEDVAVALTSAAADVGTMPLRTAPSELVELIDAFCEATKLRKRNAALIGLVRWTRKSAGSVADFSGLPGLIEYLEGNAEERTRVQTAFVELLSQVNSISLFAEAGIPSDHSFVSEIGHRISSRVLPSPREQSDAAKLLVTLYPTERSVQRFLSNTPDLFQRLVGVLTPAGDPQFASHQREDLLEALRILGSRVGALGLEPEVRARTSSPGVSDSPFYQVAASTEALIAASEPEAAPPGDDDTEPE